MNLLRYPDFPFIWSRSQDMDLYRIILPKDNDWEIMSELGQIGMRGGSPAYKASEDSRHDSSS